MMRPNGAALSPVLAYAPDTQLFITVDKFLGFGFHCTPLSGGGDATEAKLRALFEDWKTGAELQFLLHASPNVVKSLNAAQMVRTGSGLDTDRAFTLAQRRWLAQFADKPFEAIDEQWLRSFVLHITAKLPIDQGEPSEAEIKEAVAARQRLQVNLCNLDLDPRPMTNTGYVTACSEMLNRGPQAAWRRTGEADVDPHRFLREQVLDFGNVVRIDDDGVDLGGVQKLAFLTPRNMAEHAGFGLARHLVSDPVAGRRGLRGPFFLCLNVVFPDHAARKTALATRRAYALNVASSDYARWLPALRARNDDYETMFASIDSGARIVQAQIVLGVYGRDADELDRAVADAASHWQEHGYTLMRDRCINGPLLVTSMPFGIDAARVRDLGRFRTLTSEHAALFAPVFASSRGTGTPIITPVSRDGQLMSFDLYDGDKSFCGVVSGEPGTGKSVLMELLTANYLAAGARIWTIDVGHSYRNLCERMGGEYIDFERRDVSLNPFRLVHDFEDESDVLVSLIAAMASPNEDLTNIQLAALAKALKAVWDAYGVETTIDRLAAVLAGSEDLRIRDVATQLYPFTSEGAHGRYFTGENSISFTNRYTVLELQSLHSRKHLQRIVLLQLMYQIQQAMFEMDQDSRKIVLVDEAWQFLADGAVGRFIESGYRQFRKRRGALVIATQGLGDLYKTEVGGVIAENSPFKLLLGQQSDAIDRLAGEDKLPLDDAGVKYLKSLNTQKGRFSEVLICNGERYDIGRIVLDPTTQLLFSTDARDVAEIRRRRDAGMSLDRAIADLLASRAEAKPFATPDPLPPDVYPVAAE
jgi:conjugal transfer ATP-binding protein TraC